MSSQTNQSISDDQELAKVLAGVSQEADNNLQFEETGTIASPSATPVTITPEEDQAVPPVPSVNPVVNNAPIQPQPSTTQSTPDSDLDTIKQAALHELRPLVDKLNVSAEEKFDTYLLLLRSTDDKNLVAPAHDAAVAIVDEARRAQALLDIVKEIDYFSEAGK